MALNKSTVKLWFDYLKIAATTGLTVNWSFYESWGTKEELAAISFNRWWNTRGRELFADDGSASVDVKVIEKTDSHVVLRIPLGHPIDHIKRRVREIVLASRKKRRIGRRGRFAVSGQVNYKTLAQYKRFLEVDFYWKDGKPTIGDKTAELVRRYEKIHAKGLKQRMTLRKTGRASLANRFSTRDPEELTKKEIGGISPKMVSRWRLSGKHILISVAEGRFPGTGYYGANLKGRLKERLEPYGLTDLGGVSREGGRRRVDVSRLPKKKSKKELEAEALKAYSLTKSVRGL